MSFRKTRVAKHLLAHGFGIPEYFEATLRDELIWLTESERAAAIALEEPDPTPTAPEPADEAEGD